MCEIVRLCVRLSDVQVYHIRVLPHCGLVLPPGDHNKASHIIMMIVEMGFTVFTGKLLTPLFTPVALRHLLQPSKLFQKCLEFLVEISSRNKRNN